MNKRTVIASVAAFAIGALPSPIGMIKESTIAAMITILDFRFIIISLPCL